MEDLLHIIKEKFKDIELSRRHLSRIVKQNHVSSQYNHNSKSDTHLAYKIRQVESWDPHNAPITPPVHECEDDDLIERFVQSSHNLDDPFRIPTRGSDLD